MQAIFGVAQSVASLILWCDASVAAVVRRLTIWLREQSTAPHAPGVHQLELWRHGRDAFTHASPVNGLVRRCTVLDCLRILERGLGRQKLAEFFGVGLPLI